MDPAEEVGVLGEDESKEAQEDGGVAAPALEGNQKLSTLYEGAAEANHPNYALLSVGGGGDPT